jgi:hypothetical protein
MDHGLSLAGRRTLFPPDFRANTSLSEVRDPIGNPIEICRQTAT